MTRICSSESKFDQRIEEFKGYLHKRGFQKTQILSQCEKVRNKDRRLLFQDKKRFVDNNAVPLVLNFHPALSGISQKVKSLWPSLYLYNNACSFCIFIGRELCVIKVHTHG